MRAGKSSREIPFVPAELVPAELVPAELVPAELVPAELVLVVELDLADPPHPEVSAAPHTAHAQQEPTKALFIYSSSPIACLDCT